MTHTVHQQMWLKLFIPTIFKIMLLTERILSQDLLKLFNLNKLCLSQNSTKFPKEIYTATLLGTRIVYTFMIFFPRKLKYWSHNFKFNHSTPNCGTKTSNMIFYMPVKRKHKNTTCRGRGIYFVRSTHKCTHIHISEKIKHMGQNINW